MKRNIKVLGILLVLVLILSACAPKAEPDILHTAGSSILVTEQELLERADIILKGNVVEKKADYFSNPGGDKKLEDGSAVTNARITEYIVEVDTVYKGEWTEETISVKTYNDHGLQASDEGAATAQLELKMGECLLALSWFDAEVFGGPGSYMVTFDDGGYFLPEGDGLYGNVITGKSHFTIDPETLTDKIAALK